MWKAAFWTVVSLGWLGSFIWGWRCRASSSVLWALAANAGVWGLVLVSPFFYDYVDSWAPVSRSAMREIGGGFVAGSTVALLFSLIEVDLDRKRQAETSQLEARRDAMYELSEFRNRVSFNIEHTGVDASQRDLGGMHIRRKTFTSCSFYRSVLLNTDVSDSTFLDCRFELGDLARVVASSSRFRLCQFNEAVLSDATFKRARFASCDFRNALLDRADFSAARLTNCDLRGASLKGARFVDATGELNPGSLYNSKLEGCTWDESTVWPPGFTPPPSGSA